MYMEKKSNQNQKPKSKNKLDDGIAYNSRRTLKTVPRINFTAFHDIVYA